MRTFLRIVYCSRNSVVGSRAEVETQIRNILATARTNNKAARLTGALTFNDSCFAQVLEGYADDLMPIFDRIRRDPRHCDIKILAKSEPARRLFPHWSMAYVDTAFSDGRHPLAHFAFEAALTNGAEPEAQQLLDAMRRLTRKMA
jgi:Sensors of blue-light using FAD